MRAVGLPLLGTWFLGSNAPWRRAWFDLRSRTGYFGPPRPRRVLTTREAAGFLKPWTRHCPEPTVVRRERQELEPPEAAASTGMGVCLAASGRLVALASADARYHVHVIGPIGKGKSTLLASMALDRIESELATVVIDPSKGDLVRDLLPLVADQVTFIFRRLFERWWGPRTDHVLRAALLTLLRHRGTTLCDVPALLLDADARRRWTSRLQDPIGLELFWQEYETLTDSQRQQQVGPLLYKLQTVLMRPAVRNILGQQRSTIDLEQVRDRSGVLLVALPRGELGPETSSLLGSLLVARLWQVAQARSQRPEAERPDACLVLDEC